MGKSSVFSFGIFIGLLALLIYLCCRVRRRGAVLRTASGTHVNQMNGCTAVTVQQGYLPQRRSAGIGVDCPTYPSQPVYPATTFAGVYSPTTMAAPQPQGYSVYPGTHNTSSVPYPHPVGGSGMPMPMPMQHNAFQQAGAYPQFASAPVPDDDDRPPSYDDAIRNK